MHAGIEFGFRLAAYHRGEVKHRIRFRREGGVACLCTALEDRGSRVPRVRITKPVTAAIDRICAAIADEGCAIEADFLPRASVAALAEEAHARDAAGEFHTAGVGRGAAHV